MSNALPAPDPSMDEILASIKRIIESGDEKVIKRQPGHAQGDVAVPSFPASYAEALRPVANEPRDQPSEDLADTRWYSQARHERPEDAEDLQSFSTDEAEPRPAADEDVSGFDAAIGGSRFDDDAFETELVELIGDGDELAGEGFAAPEQGDDIEGPARFAAANSDEAGLRQPSRAALDEPPIVAARALADPTETHRLISQEAGARVAASFEDLARAIREDQMRSVEDAVQEMLRPMLQDWLDDNLPRLVERLVREEIERVATGGRR
ncbi:PopZ family protein [Aurantimonas endophytica]|uniref:Cell pole-organizing protein PopZ n=1 Tax=Aurantimonas endophytica TaxID=1522175 RepID=A0A7W6HAV5_9HYPH|nr:DUF2497 domain-containing protein [Aurantimonas endophytica]MBB4001752.1 cell pole-organizing protein PopZ [Aurantimonas endophytica]